MQTVTDQNFGILIAYIIPGLIVFFGVLNGKEWCGQQIHLVDQTSTIGGFLMIAAFAVGFGVVINGIRQSMIDVFRWCLKRKRKIRSYKKLQNHIGAIDFLVLNQFRYHQFHANSALALIFVSVFDVRLLFDADKLIGGVILISILLLAAGKSLSLYYQRLDEILGQGSEI